MRIWPRTRTLLYQSAQGEREITRSECISRHIVPKEIRITSWMGIIIYCSACTPPQFILRNPRRRCVVQLMMNLHTCCELDPPIKLLSLRSSCLKIGQRLWGSNGTNFHIHPIHFNYDEVNHRTITIKQDSLPSHKYTSSYK